MTWNRTLPTAALGSALLLAACAAPTPRRVAVPPTARTVGNHILYAPTTWEGDIRVDRPLVVTRAATLTLRPGTRVFFDFPPAPETGKDPEPWILVLGSLVAVGNAENPVTFLSVAPRDNQLEDMIQIRAAKEAHVRFALFQGGPWGIHTHDTPVDIEDSVFRNNYGGVRFHGGPIRMNRNRFETNRIGVRCLESSPVIEGNVFVDNLTGIFFRHGISSPVLRHNDFHNREYDVKLGEAQTENLPAGDNWWGGAEDPGERIYDGADTEGVGRVLFEPPLAGPFTPEGSR